MFWLEVLGEGKIGRGSVCWEMRFCGHKNMRKPCLPEGGKWKYRRISHLKKSIYADNPTLLYCKESQRIPIALHSFGARRDKRARRVL